MTSASAVEIAVASVAAGAAVVGAGAAWPVRASGPRSRTGQRRPGRSPRPVPARRAGSLGRLGPLGAMLGSGVVVVVVVVTVGPAAAVVLVAVGIVGRGHRARAARRRVLAARDRSLPDLVDLFVIAAAAGHTVHGCLEAVVARAPGPVEPALRRAHGRVRRGESLQVALAGLGDDLGPLGRSLADALAAGAATGSPVAPALGRVAAAAHERRRRSAEEAARRLPVTLLFPLVCCVLPAFLVLAVVPLLAASLGSLAA